jgi:signal transduction histidine kinase/ActR/RegA family two-component response regulator
MTSHEPRIDAGLHVLVFAPIGRDAELTRGLLNRASIPCAVFLSIDSLAAQFAADGGGALLLTEEALEDARFPELIEVLQQQPPWSDVPVLVFAGGPGEDVTRRTVRSIETLRNVTLLERPIRLAVVLSTIRAALRGRTRQYEVRDLLVALHRARTEAESANRLKDEFLATLSHELRTPMNAIIGWTSMLVRGQVEPGYLPRVFEALDRNAQSQAQLIADVLDVSRIVTGKLQLQLATVDVCDIVARASEAIRPAAAAKGIALTTEISENCLATADADRLQQVFWNLLSNAVKFTPGGGSVQVEITREEADVTVSVSDNGVGIPPEFVPFVFDRFRQADQTATRTHGGLGLGLAIVKHLTELHGGSVSAASAGIGRGARFEVRLPAAADSTLDRKAQEPGAAAADVHLGGRTILVVDDDPSNREVLAATLATAGAQVQVAASVGEAKSLLHDAQPPALIIADLAMPDEDGFAFIRFVRESQARHVPAVALSAHADAQSQNAALDAGFSVFLAKPARPQALIELVATLLNVSSSSNPSVASAAATLR